MAVTTAMAVSAAGQISGGLAADAIMGDTSYPKGGGIEGLTSANAGKSGIPAAVQIDPSKALDYFKTAAEDYEKNAKTGLNYYQSAISAATQQLSAGYTMANQTLSGLATRGGSALDQYMKVLGLNTPSPTANLGSQIRNMGLTDIADQMDLAEKIQNPTERAKYKEHISWMLQSQINDRTYKATVARDQQLAALGQMPPVRTLQKDANGIPINVKPGEEALAALKGDPAWINKDINTYNASLNAINSSYQQQIQGIQSSLGSIHSNFSNNYKQEADYFGYTNDDLKRMGIPVRPELGEAIPLPEVPKEITAESLKDFPGYQFALQQGLGAAERSAAAKGMLNSGNTLAALTEYAEGLATQTYGLAEDVRQANFGMALDVYGAAENARRVNFGMGMDLYNNYMSGLLNVAGIGVDATHQTAANYANMGTGLAGLSVGLGNAGMDTYQGIGKAWYDTQTHSGDVWNMDMLENMKAQNEMISGNASQGAALAGQAMNAGVQQGYLGQRQREYNDSRMDKQQQATSYNRNYQWASADRGRYGLA